MSSSRKKLPRPVGRPHKLDNVRAQNIAALYDALRREQCGEPLVSITASLSDPASDSHLIIKRNWRTLLPKWRELNTLTKDLLRHCALHRRGASAFSLNLGDDVLSTHSYGDIRSRNSLRNRITKALREEFDKDVPFTFTMELDRDNRLHLHGSVGVTRAEHGRLRECLRKAGGKWGHSSGHAFQVRPDDLLHPDAWHKYIGKDFRPGNPVKAKHSIAKSRSADDMAKSLYAEMLHFLQDHANELDTVRVNYETGREEGIRLIGSFFSQLHIR